MLLYFVFYFPVIGDQPQPYGHDVSKCIHFVPNYCLSWSSPPVALFLFFSRDRHPQAFSFLILFKDFLFFNRLGRRKAPGQLHICWCTDKSPPFKSPLLFWWLRLWFGRLGLWRFQWYYLIRAVTWDFWAQSVHCFHVRYVSWLRVSIKWNECISKPYSVTSDSQANLSAAPKLWKILLFFSFLFNTGGWFAGFIQCQIKDLHVNGTGHIWY